MNIAYLVLCHKNPIQVSALINKLNDNNTDFFIHIDKKAENFETVAGENVFIIPKENRIDVQWATNSMVRAEIELIHFMLSRGKKYDYVFLISGQDFPIKSNEEIQSFLMKNNGCNFIEVIEHTDKRYKRYIKRNELYYPKQIQSRNVKMRILKKLYIYLTGGAKYTFAFFKRKNHTKMMFEFGSQWWCLTYECLKWIIDYMDENEEVVSFFDNALTSDECVFQTLFMSSPYKNTRKDKLTYLELPENKNNPRLLGKDDYDLLKNSDCLFARKFDINIEPQIVKMLEEKDEIVLKKP